MNAGLNNKASSPLKKAGTTFSFSPITKLVKPAEEPETPSTGNVSMLSGNQYTVLFQSYSHLVEQMNHKKVR